MSKRSDRQLAQQESSALTQGEHQPESGSAEFSEVMSLQDAAGNRATSDLLGPPPPNGRPLPDGFRGSMEQGYGVDFSAVRVRTDEEAAKATKLSGSRAVTVGQEIAFRPDAYQPDTPQGQTILAHELGHVVQQARGQTSALAAGQHNGERSRLEQDASASGSLVLSGGSLAAPPAAAAAAPVAQGFDPFAHREATVEGMSGIFSPAVIGRVYQGNWERDFSQAGPIAADVVIAWKAVEQSAKGDKPTPKAAQQFNETLARVKGMLTISRIGEIMGQTYGGYRYWEHMDNPGAKEAKAAEKRWNPNGNTGQLPAYLLDSRAYLKEMLADSVHTVRGGALPQGIRDEAWQGSSGKPEGYGEKTAEAKSNPRLRADPVSEEAKKQAEDFSAKSGRRAGATAGLGSTSGPNPAADSLGRASHAVEDFFAHSNFVELAEKQMAGSSIDPGQIMTGRVELADNAYTLSHKIEAIVNQILPRLELMRNVINSGQKAGKSDKEEPTGGFLSNALAPMIGLGLVGTVSGGAIGAAAGAGGVAGGIAGGVGLGILGAALGGYLGLKASGTGKGAKIGAVLGGILGAVGGAVLGAFFPVVGTALAGAGLGVGLGALLVPTQLQTLVTTLLTSKRLLLDLKGQAEKLGQWALSKAAPDSHSKLAKDQPGHGHSKADKEKTRKFHIALDYAKRANRRIFAPVQRAMAAGDEAAASAALREAYDQVDAIINIPSPAHPLTGQMADFPEPDKDEQYA